MLKKLKRLHQMRAENGDIPVSAPESLYMRVTDEILCYWQGSAGTFGWLFRRGTQLYLYLVLGMSQPKGINWAQQSPGDCDIVRAFMSMLGFTEYSLHCPVCEVGDALAPLYKDMAIYKAAVMQQQSQKSPVPSQDAAVTNNAADAQQ